MATLHHADLKVLILAEDCVCGDVGGLKVPWAKILDCGDGFEVGEVEAILRKMISR